MKNLIDRERLRENRNRIAEKNKAGGPKDTKAAPAKGDGRGNPNRKGIGAVEYIGKRHAICFLSEAYCKGLVRGQVECCNLRANHVDGSIVAAERLSTCGFAMFPMMAQNPLNVLKQTYSGVLSLIICF